MFIEFTKSKFIIKKDQKIFLLFSSYVACNLIHKYFLTVYFLPIYYWYPLFIDKMSFFYL